MIDIDALVGTVTAVLMALLGKAADKSAEKVGETATDSLIGSLKKKLGRAEAKDAVEQVAKRPDAPDAQVALKAELRKALETQPDLEAELQRWLEETQAIPRTGTATATGDNNIVQVIHGSGNVVTNR